MIPRKNKICKNNKKGNMEKFYEFLFKIRIFESVFTFLIDKKQ